MIFTNSHKMGKQPYIPWYVGDYLKDTRHLPLNVRGAWVDLILFMWDAERRGEMIGTVEEIARMVSCDVSEAKYCIEMLAKKKTADITVLPSGEFHIVSRRMKRDTALSNVRAVAGSKGGKNAKNTHTKRLYNKPGFIYLMADKEAYGEFKIGISTDPKKRLLQLRYQTERELEIRCVVATDNMGMAEDNVLAALQQYANGEWLSGVSEGTIVSLLRQQNNSNRTANTTTKDAAKPEHFPEYEYEGDNESDFESKNDADQTFDLRQKVKDALFSDEQFMTALRMNHKGKDFEPAFNECYLHHSNSPSPPEHLWQWKQKFNTWLINKRPNVDSKASKGTTRTTGAIIGNQGYEDERL